MPNHAQRERALQRQQSGRLVAAHRRAGEQPGPVEGAVVLAGSDGSFTYTPYANATGTDTFTYKAKDGSGALSAAATVTITLNQSPVAHDDSSFSTEVRTTVNGSIAADVTDDGPAPLTFSLVNGPEPRRRRTASP